MEGSKKIRICEFENEEEDEAEGIWFFLFPMSHSLLFKFRILSVLKRTFHLYWA